MTNVNARRSLLKVAMFSMFLRAARASGWSGHWSASPTGTRVRPEESREATIRSYYSGWEQKQWSAIESVLAEDFTFSSPNNDDHIDRRAFKDRCWPGADAIGTIKLQSVLIHGDEGFAKYLMSTKDGKSIQNVEYFKFTEDKVSAIEVYFGGKWGYPGQRA